MKSSLVYFVFSVECWTWKIPTKKTYKYWNFCLSQQRAIVITSTCFLLCLKLIIGSLHDVDLIRIGYCFEWCKLMALLRWITSIDASVWQNQSSISPKAIPIFVHCCCCFYLKCRFVALHRRVTCRNKIVSANVYCSQTEHLPKCLLANHFNISIRLGRQKKSSIKAVNNNRT